MTAKIATPQPADRSATLRGHVERLRAISKEIADASREVTDILDRTSNAQLTPSRELDANLLQNYISARSMRRELFAADLFVDPAWDILLAMLLAEVTQRRVTVTELCTAGDTPATTGLRWLNSLFEAGVLIRRPDPTDARRVFLELTEEASLKLRSYFAAARVFALV